VEAIHTAETSFDNLVVRNVQFFEVLLGLGACAQLAFDLLEQAGLHFLVEQCGDSPDFVGLEAFQIDGVLNRPIRNVVVDCFQSCIQF
jgi:hypothetical protein